MEKIKAEWHGSPFYDTSIKKWLITFEIGATPKFFDKLKDKTLSLVIKQYSEKRSKRANDYFHTLVDMIAKTLGVSHTEIHNQMIADYGCVDESVPDGTWLRDDIPWERLDCMHLRPTTEFGYSGSNMCRRYDIMRGSHTYDTKEMSQLIDGVVFEAKSLGLETKSPEELERMKQLWIP